MAEIGRLLQYADQIPEGIAAITEALEIAKRPNDPHKVSIRLEQLGTIHEQQGEYEAALEKYQQALALARKYMSPQEVAIVEQDIARVREKLGG